jgi:hypothetical protein
MKFFEQPNELKESYSKLLFSTVFGGNPTGYVYPVIPVKVYEMKSSFGIVSSLTEAQVS